MCDDGIPSGFREMVENFWAETRKRAENGDPDAAREILDAALGSLETGTAFDPDVKAFMVRAIREVLNGVPAEDAFLLTGKSGRPPDQETDRDISLAACVIVVMRDKGISKTKASSQAAAQYGERWGLDVNSQKTFERAFNQYGEALQKNTTDFLRQIAFTKFKR